MFLNTIRYHTYADDTQLYVEFSHGQPTHLTTANDRILRCTIDVKERMSCHNLLLNENKTESAVNNRKHVQPSVDQVIDV